MNVCILDCDSVGDLKKSFNIVFEEIANNRTIQIYVSLYTLPYTIYSHSFRFLFPENVNCRSFTKLPKIL